MKTVLLVVGCLVVAALMLLSCAPLVTDEEEGTPANEIPIPSEISRSGWINEDATWSDTVHITGDTWVDSEVTITILPGTEVLFTAHKNAQAILANSFEGGRQ